ncbi:hypothetical protein CLIB1423_18S01354 [[Candida] railenensis]|uniref:Outer spore wall protein RRT8 n=1 Tax=[Candida] railenensis TaxID=45579 RepID=A0A9P0QTJ1_9ASCO|nr:hypothetical protein CLIB1423_18S01354 [[Candida] railenensis]
MIADTKRPLQAPINMIFSGTYLFPLYGIYYFIIHPSLWPFYLTILVPELVFILLIYVVSYILLFPAQAIVAVVLAGPGGLVGSWISVLQQASHISTILCSILVLPEVQRVVFDAVLSREFQNDVVLLGKLRRVVKVPFLVRLGHLVYFLPALLVLPWVILRGIVLLGLSSVPYIGPIIVAILQASTKGLQSHSRYFALKGFDRRQVTAIYRENTGQYMGYGFIANLLDSIPILNLFFMFTNAIGSALWVVSIEEQIKEIEGEPSDFP